jgi:hypothetical protein
MPARCLGRTCRDYKAANKTFSYHTLCQAVFQLFSKRTLQATDQLPQLGNALDPTLPVEDPSCTLQATDQLLQLGNALHPILPVEDPSGPGLASDIFKSSLCRQTLKSLKRSLEHVSCSTPSCKCCVCLIRQLRSLPNEILSNSIAPLAAPSHLQGVFAVFGETFNLLPELRKRPAGRYQVSVRAALFETRIKYGRTSYITGLYNEQVPESSLIKPCDKPYDHIVVWLDRIGVTNVTFLPQGVSLPTKSGSQWMYAVIALNDHVDIKSKVRTNACERYATHQILGRFSRADHGHSCPPYFLEQPTVTTAFTAFAFAKHPPPKPRR